jgi:hypothetical protein
MCKVEWMLLLGEIRRKLKELLLKLDYGHSSYNDAAHCCGCIGKLKFFIPARRLSYALFL